MTPKRVALVCDLREEGWPSMDLVADMLLAQMQTNYSAEFKVTPICPPLRRRLTGAASAGVMSANALRATRFNADRFLNRFWDYPRHVSSIRSEFDLFHLIDHSYGQLVHELPAEKTIVTCHDLDTFQCLLNPKAAPRSIYFRRMMERTLSGFRKAARVACVSNATRVELLAHDLIEPERVVVVSNGVHPAYTPAADPLADEAVTDLLGPLDRSPGQTPELLHVGSTIPRKRIDVLLRIFAAVRDQFPRARLVRVGGAFTREQATLVSQLDLGDSVVVLPALDRKLLASVYRRAALLLQPSEREGFGLPVVEALASGTAVVASDLPSLREVGGGAVVYCPVAEVQSWSETVTKLLRGRTGESWGERREAGLAQAAKFSWAEHARRVAALYRELL